MAVVSVSRWKGNPQDTSLAKEIAPVLKKHGAVSVRLGNCFAGAYAGQVFGVISYPDWETYGKAMQSLTTDPEYQRIMTGLTSTFDLQERWLASIEDL
jgi:hypothetical protein